MVPVLREKYVQEGMSVVPLERRLWLWEVGPCPDPKGMSPALVGCGKEQSSWQAARDDLGLSTSWKILESLSISNSVWTGVWPHLNPQEKACSVIMPVYLYPSQFTRSYYSVRVVYNVNKSSYFMMIPLLLSDYFFLFCEVWGRSFGGLEVLECASPPLFLC